jgi:hypothetical protein
MDEAGGIRLPAAEEAPSAPASAPSTEAVLIAASGGGSGRARGERVKAGRVGGPTRSGLRLGQSDSGAWADERLDPNVLSFSPFQDDYL